MGFMRRLQKIEGAFITCKLYLPKHTGQSVFKMLSQNEEIVLKVENREIFSDWSIF